MLCLVLYYITSAYKYVFTKLSDICRCCFWSVCFFVFSQSSSDFSSILQSWHIKSLWVPVWRVCFRWFLKCVFSLLWYEQLSHLCMPCSLWQVMCAANVASELLVSVHLVHANFCSTCGFLTFCCSLGMAPECGPGLTWPTVLLFCRVNI